VSRNKCEECRRPQEICLCPWVETVSNDFPLLVLRHKSEAKESLNTAALLELCLKSFMMIDGEVFEPDIIPEDCSPIILFPSEGAQPLESLIDQGVPDNALFILIDGTWKKARKILYMNPWLTELPAILLPPVKSRYILRKKHDDGSSTLEAAAALMSSLDNDAEKYRPLYALLDRMQQFQIERMPPGLFEKHFQDRL